VTEIIVATAIISLLISTVLLVAVVVFVWWLDRYDREPLQLVAGVFVWGAGAAPLLAAASGSMIASTLGHPGTGTFLGAGLEELFKAIAVVLVARYSADFDTPTDGLVYGTAAGLGFAAVENVVYTVAAASTLDGPGLLLGMVAGRTLCTAGVHALASGVVGGLIGVAYLSSHRLARLGWAIFGLGAGTLLHGAWNLAFARAEAGELLQWPLLAVLPVLYCLYLAAFICFLRWEHRVLRVELEEEASLKLVPPWVPEVIPFYRRRIRSDWWPRRAERVVLSRLLTRLAFRKFQTARLPESEASVAALEIVRLRTRVRRMLAPAAVSPDEEIVKPLSK
jgi:RsiW-degrading membrane proteinase PrsW (M82 family)